LVRVAQSALANTVQHARVGRVELTLSYMETEVALDVVDDGCGFDPGTIPVAGDGGAGFGLAAMRARIRALSGSLTIESAPGQGTALAVTLALPVTEGSGR
jgi:signal transduction histidine kinase